MSIAQTPVGRRTVLAGGATGAGLAGLAVASSTVTAAAGDAGGARVFRHGIASGDPLPHAVLIWTRVTPTEQSTPGSGRGPSVRVRWEVATDAGFRRVVRSGDAETGPSRDHTVKIDVTGLDPATTYHYRFHCRGVTSRAGRTRTAPADDALPGNLRFGVVSCANLQAGWFSAYRGIARRDDLDGVIHLGDYLYEYGPGEYGYGQGNVDIRKHEPPHEMVSLADYRQRHAQYKRDADLQDAHARFAWIVTWDDHEVTNDQWSDGAENHTPGDGEGGEGDYARRRARAHRAYDEWMPVRLDGTARLGDGDRLFRRLRFGRLAELSMLDLRTHRSEQAASPAPPAPFPNGEVSDPDRTITGDQQLSWLEDSLRRHRDVQWKLVGNPVMIAPVNVGDLPDEVIDPVNDVTGLLPANGAPYNVDQWDGYTADRRRLFDFIRNHQVKDTVFITGDIHSGWAADLPYDAATYTGQGLTEDTAGVEFVCTSVTSNNLKDITGTPPRTTSLAVEAAIIANNRHIKYLNFDDHGFSVLDLTPKRAQMDWFVISDRADRDATITWTRSFATAAGSNRVVEVDGPVGG